MNDPVLESLVIQNETKIVLFVLDGLGDLPNPDHGGKTPLEAARTPHLDAIVPRAALGRILPVAPGITPGSGPGHMALFGYDPVATSVGRGVLEALGAGMDFRGDDVAARANFCSLDGDGIVTDRRAGRISSERCAALVEALRSTIDRVGDVQVILQAGKGHRFVAVLRGPGLGGEVSDADPHREGHPVPEAKPHADDPRAEKTAHVVNEVVSAAAKVLAAEHPANGILMRGISQRPQFPSYRDRFKLRAAAIAAYPMYRGVAELAGMDVYKVAEGPANAFAQAADVWGDHDYFFIHHKATDMAGEDGDFDAKVRAVEDADAALPALLDLKPDVLCVTGDHSTPVMVKGHSWHPVPVLVLGPLCGADAEARFDEKTARRGSLGTFASSDLMAVLMANAGRLDKFGA